MKRAKCMVCGFDVAVINCHYNCSNCGFAASWEEGSDPSSGYDKKDETLLINILAKKKSLMTEKKWKKIMVHGKRRMNSGEKLLEVNGGFTNTLYCLTMKSDKLIVKNHK